MKLIVLLALTAAPSWGAGYALVQSKACSNNTLSPQANACQLSSSVDLTHLLIVACIGSRLTACLTVSDDQNNAYRLVNSTLTTAAASGGTAVWGIFYATASSAGFTTPTCSDPCGNTTWIEQSVFEYSGNMFAADPWDVVASSSSATLITTTTAISPAITTSKNGELIFAIAPALPSAATAGNGSIRTNTVDNTFWATEDTVLDSAGVYVSSFTFASNNFVNRITQAAFKPPTPPPPGIHNYR